MANSGGLFSTANLERYKRSLLKKMGRSTVAIKGLVCLREKVHSSPECFSNKTKLEEYLRGTSRNISFQGGMSYFYLGQHYVFRL